MASRPRRFGPTNVTWLSDRRRPTLAGHVGVVAQAGHVGVVAQAGHVGGSGEAAAGVGPSGLGTPAVLASMGRGPVTGGGPGGAPASAGLPPAFVIGAALAAGSAPATASGPRR